jgi:3-oxoisoapionate kinase
MGKLLRNVILASGVTRVVVAGGDTASHAVRELDIAALTYRAPLARGAPLCRAHGWRGNLELVLKGGQVGPEDFFQKVKLWA